MAGVDSGYRRGLGADPSRRLEKCAVATHAYGQVGVRLPRERHVVEPQGESVAEMGGEVVEKRFGENYIVAALHERGHELLYMLEISFLMAVAVYGYSHGYKRVVNNIC